MDETTKAAGDTQSEDQLAIADYFASDSFRDARLKSVADRTMDDYPLFTISVVLLALLTACSVWAIGMLKMIENTNSVPSFPKAILMTDVMTFPISTVMTFAVVIAFFWRGPLWRRVVVSLSIVVPAMAVFLGLARMTMDYVDSEFVLNMIACFFGFFVGASATTVLFEMFSPFTLMERNRVNQAKLAPTSLRAFFELTIFFALIFVAASIFSDDQLLIVAGFAGAWSALLATSVIASAIAFLSDKQVPKVAWIVAGVGCVLPSFFMTGASAMGGFAWTLNLVNFLSVALLSLIGVTLQVAFLALGIRIVSSHGCMCINRRKLEIVA